MPDQTDKSTTTIDRARSRTSKSSPRNGGIERGPMAPLHKFNPVRLAYIRDQAAAHFTRDRKQAECLSGLRILDIGCGGGILSEPLARLGALDGRRRPGDGEYRGRAQARGAVGAVDRLSRHHRRGLADAGERFDIVLAMEVVEHVTDVDLFVRRCGEMVKPGGMMIAATLNRTMKSFALAIVGAEYVLRWLPRGTHRWDKFVTPDELETAMSHADLRVVDERGVIYNLFADSWQLSDDMDVNYMLTAA